MRKRAFGNLKLTGPIKAREATSNRLGKYELMDEGLQKIREFKKCITDNHNTGD